MTDHHEPAPAAAPAGGGDEGDPSDRRWSRRRIAGVGALGLLVVFGLAQLIPYRIDNPPVRQEPVWPSAEARALAVRACFDCHSNQTKVPWYGHIAPVSWWTASHVKEGRSKVNFSDWSKRREGRLAETVANGSMPPSFYTWFGLHKDAKLSAKEKADLIAALQQLEGPNTRGGDG